MARTDPPEYRSGDLYVCPGLGQLANSENATVRLGPVNMKVLMALLEQAGHVVSRSELFEVVWGNQIVGEDALTRCISDIRAELKKLSGREDLIETLPKRGYRWKLEVRESTLSTDARGDPAAIARGEPAASAQREPAATGADSGVRLPAKPRPRRSYLRVAARGLTYLFAFVVLAIAGVWLADQLSRPGLPVVALLPVSAEPSRSELAMRVENELTDQLMNLSQVELLSDSAVASRPDNPFPFFYYEFGARWVLEAEVQRLSGRDVLMLAIVDARTGIVLMQHAEPVTSVSTGVTDSIEKSLRTIEPLIGSGSLERR